MYEDKSTIWLTHAEYTAPGTWPNAHRVYTETDREQLAEHAARIADHHGVRPGPGGEYPLSLWAHAEACADAEAAEWLSLV